MTSDKIKKAIQKEMRDIAKEYPDLVDDSGYIEVDRLNGEEGYNLGHYRAYSAVLEMLG